MLKSASAIRQTQKIIFREIITTALRKSLNDAFPQIDTGISEQDIEICTKIWMLGAIPTGDENPRDILGKLSDKTLAHMASKESAPGQPAHMICQLSLLEWCRRNGHLNGDWNWQWENDNGLRGKANFIPKIPLEEALSILRASCVETVQKLNKV